MEKAVELAEKKTMMYIAAKEVGIPDPNYFLANTLKIYRKTYSEMSKGKPHKAFPLLLKTTYKQQRFNNKYSHM